MNAKRFRKTTYPLALSWMVAACWFAGGGWSQARGETLGDPAPSVHRLWPDEPPAWQPPQEPEGDTTGEDGRLVAGKRVIRLGHVSTPQLHVYRPPAGSDTGTAVVICPGGGYSILAWDLEGTEIAEWLQGLGVTAAVLKYRVPTRGADQRWLAPVQDIQRAVGVIRSGGIEGVDVERVGVLGFSAGGNAAVRASVAKQRYYDAVDRHDRTSPRPDFAILVYPAWLVQQDDPTKLDEAIEVDGQTPPMFFAHARDDRVTCMSSVQLFAALIREDIPAALHVFSGGGHGFGARPTGEEHDAWPALCERWLQTRGWLTR